MKRFVFISRNYKHPGCGGGRARTDIEMVMERMGYENIGLRRTTSGNGIVHSLRNLWSTLHAIGKMRKGDVVVIQYQMKMYGRICRAAHRRGAKVICLIHDLDSWRDKKLTPEQEMPLLNMADVLLTHNHAMRRWLTEHGCTTPMVDYEIMDYAPNGSLADMTLRGSETRFKEVAMRMAFAIRQCHELGFIHRDIKGAAA